MTIHHGREVCLHCGADMKGAKKVFSRHFCSQACTIAYKIESAKRERVHRLGHA